MINLLFSPSGRIGPAEFMRAALILIALGLVFSLPEFLGLPDVVSLICNVLSLVLIYCWVVIWIKRYHDAGKDGILCLLPIGIYIILAIILMAVIMGGPLMEMTQAASEGASKAQQEAIMQPVILPMAIAGTVLNLAVAFFFNKIIKSDPLDNKFGPPTNV